MPRDGARVCWGAALTSWHYGEGAALVAAARRFPGLLYIGRWPQDEMLMLSVLQQLAVVLVQLQIVKRRLLAHVRKFGVR